MELKLSIMKTKKSIAHFTNEEQAAINNLKKKLIHVYNPLLIYLIAIKNSNIVKRDYLSYPIKSKKNGISLDVLVIVPDGFTLFNHQNKIDNIHCTIMKVNLLTYTISEFHHELSAKSAFFYGVKKRAVVLYEHENTLENLSSFHMCNQLLKEKLIKATLIKTKYKNYKVNTLYFSNGKNITHVHDFFELPILSEELQNALATLLKRYGAKTINVKLRKVILEYAYSVTQDGVPNDFDETLLYFRDLMEMFDVAEKR
jgi:hypothetical protein